MLILGIIFSLLTICTLFQPLLSKETLASKKDYHPKHHATYFLPSAGFLFFGGFAWWAFLVAKTIPLRTIAMDEDGLWYGHLSKESGLIPWSKIVQIKARRISSRLELWDDLGNVLLKVEHQLVDFQKLRAAILSKIQGPFSPPTLPVSYGKKTFYHLFNIGISGFFFLLGLSASQYGNPMGYICMMIVAPLCLYEYLRTAYKITVNQNHITIHYPGRLKTYSFQDILAIKLESYRIKSSPHPEVRVWIKSRSSPLKLRYLGVEAFVLERVLSNARETCLAQS